ncbi:MAG: hypothetical protein AVDCRST_MAG26-3175, partial [uncultured Chloroflexia bacterium]
CNTSSSMSAMARHSSRISREATSRTSQRRMRRPSPRCKKSLLTGWRQVPSLEACRSKYATVPDVSWQSFRPRPSCI